MPRFPWCQSWARLLGPHSCHTSMWAWGRFPGERNLPIQEVHGRAVGYVPIPLCQNLGQGGQPPGTSPSKEKRLVQAKAHGFWGWIWIPVWATKSISSATLGQDTVNLYSLNRSLLIPLLRYTLHHAAISDPLNHLDHIQSCPVLSDAPHLRGENRGLAITHKTLHDLSDSSPNTVLPHIFCCLLEAARYGPTLGPLSQGNHRSPSYIISSKSLFRVTFAMKPILTTPLISAPLPCHFLGPLALL